jgi:hypothetical protein
MKNKYAGVTLDWYDDKGATLKARFPTAGSLPNIIKEADIRPLEKLANEDFALVAIDEGNILRKFACHDPGTTAMSVIYFMEHGDKLPEGAQKMAAANLVGACERFELVPPKALAKTAGAAYVDGVYKDSPHRGGFFGSRPGVKSKYPLGGAAVGAAALGVPAALLSGGNARSRLINAALAGGAGAILGGGAGALHGLRVSDKEDLENWAKIQRGKGVDVKIAASKVVDITGQRPTPKVKVAAPKSAADYAVVLGGKGYYPIHTWDLVKKAEVYFHEERGRMQPEIRRQYAVKLAAKALAIGYPVDPEIVDAGSTEWASSGHLKAAVEMRKIACAPGDSRDFLDELFEKRATIEPATYSEVLRRFDVEHGFDRGWGHVILDPWASTFGMNKTADVVWEDGNDRVTSDQLVSLAQNHLKRMRQILTEEMCKEFQKDPVGIFESMPLPQKKIISRLASDHPENSEITQAVV